MGKYNFVKLGEPNECSHCDEVFNDRMEFRTHVSDMHPKILQCEYLACAYQTDQRKYMKRHQRTVHEKNPIACSIVGCDFIVNYDYMKRHVRDYHTDELNKTLMIRTRESSVESCDQQSTSSGLNNDDPVEPQDIQLYCPSCPKVFWTRDKLKRHVARVHEKRYKNPVREKKYKCAFDGCGKGYTTPGKLKDHENSHTGEKPFECGRCEKSFGGRELFAKHLREYHAISIKDVVKMLNI